MWHKTKLPEFTTSIQQEAWRQRLGVSIPTAPVMSPPSHTKKPTIRTSKLTW